ncbi:acetyl-CoA acetyltransferase [Kibdelosporangium philippinense]|uniref:Acetyl-CoA acetyltransferase n=1 Tax=Kibdelosporangium philippinense TaxID=211113 RepID=A0ABS8Z2J7_9PSEU|nr:acetyl-CoA acetyltransferase [Kibdelosporangium philippinense]MCE7002010.1 acetyl-CoA acetyltransferase [Kibdelosporangium philippinense]
MSIRGKTAITGIAEVDTFQTDGRSPASLAAVASKRALDDAGLKLSDVDGLFTTSSYYAMPTLTMSEHLGIKPRFTDSTALGGCSFVAHLGHAAAAIEAGLCDVALVCYGSTQRSDHGKLVSNADWLAYEQPYGLLHPVGSFGLIAHRHMAQYGTTSEQLAQIAVAARSWALLNPDAPYPKPLTVDDVLGSPLIASPLHKLDCCLVTDGGAAVVLTSAERARDLPKPPVYLLGTGEASNHRNISQMPDLTTTEATRSAERAMRMAGVTHADIDTAHVYDAFTISLLILLEDLGFCPKGEGGRYVQDGNIAPGGSLALNTNGGGLSYTHPGMLGMFLITEAVRQLRGEAGARQRQDASVSLVHGMGLTLAAHATAVLGVG